MMFNELDDQQLLRYSRQIFLPELDIAGQVQLANSHISVIGCGGLGSLTAAYLAAAGVGRLTLVDFDVVDLTNLHRQLAFDKQSLGKSKVAELTEFLQARNPDCSISAIDQRLDEAQMASLFEDVDLVLDGTDRFAVRHQINRACRTANVPLLSAAVVGFAGQLVLFDYEPGTPCYDCLYTNVGSEQNNCSENGVLGPVVGCVASLQALEALKFCVGMDVSVRHRLAVFDAKTLRWNSLAIRADSNCAVCGSGLD